MKVLFDPIVKKVSGRLGNLVFSPYNNIVNIAGEESVSGIIRMLSETLKENVRRNNVNTAFRIASEEWRNISIMNRTGWMFESARISDQTGVKRSPRAFFIGYFVNKYASQLSTFVKPTTLSDGSGKEFESADSRMWS